MTRDPTALKGAARKGPVAITEYKRPRFVPMSADDYQALIERTRDPRRGLRTGAMPMALKARALKTLDRP